MLTKKIVFLSAQPDVPYFHWQVEVMIHNFIKHGINPNWIEILWAYDNEPSAELLSLSTKYPYVRFFSYKKTPIDNFGYIPILRPDIIEQHFIKYPELRGETILYHDSDIIFRELPNFDEMHGDLYWYLSDTISYIGAEYIRSKSNDLFVDMCNIVGILPEVVDQNQKNSGGAQYLMKGVTSNYWKGVKDDSLALYKYMVDRENLERTTLTPEELQVYNPVQKWCADMWAVLWGAWKLGAQTVIEPGLSFSWGSSNLAEYLNNNIMHNAGITSNQEGKVFYKGEFINRNPFEFDFSNIDQDTASAKYVDAIIYAKEMRS